MIRTLKVERIHPNPDQPRQTFDEAYIAGLAKSIKQNGLLEPIKVTRRDSGYMIVFGECRWRAHNVAGLTTIKAHVEDLDDADVDCQAIVENDQRADVPPLEQARAYRRYMDVHGVTDEELATKLGKPIWRIRERTTLLRLEPDYQKLLESGNLTPSQAFEMGRQSPDNQRRLFGEIRKGHCDSYSRLRAASDGLLEAETQSEMFDADDCGPSEAEVSTMGRLEQKIERVVGIVASGFEDNEIVVVRKIDPSRASTMADKLRVIQKHLADMELALRKSSVQGAML